MTRAAAVAGSLSVVFGLVVGITIASRSQGTGQTAGAAGAFGAAEAPLATAPSTNETTVPTPTTVAQAQSTASGAAGAAGSDPSAADGAATNADSNGSPDASQSIGAWVAPGGASAGSSSGTVRAVDGTLSAVLTAGPDEGTAGMTVSFVVTITDTSAAGPFGPSSIVYGDGAPAPQTGLAATCRAGTPSAALTQSFDYSHSYSNPGTYSLSVEVEDPCASEQVVLDLPIDVNPS